MAQASSLWNYCIFSHQPVLPRGAATPVRWGLAQTTLQPSAVLGVFQVGGQIRTTPMRGLRHRSGLEVLNARIKGQIRTTPMRGLRRCDEHHRFNRAALVYGQIRTTPMRGLRRRVGREDGLGLNFGADQNDPNEGIETSAISSGLFSMCLKGRSERPQ